MSTEVAFGAHAAPGSQHAPHLNPLGLCEMPSPWLEELARDLDPDSCVALLGTCRPMRDLVLSQRDVVVEVLLGDPANLTPEARLVLACKHSSRVKVALFAGVPVDRGTAYTARHMFRAAMGRGLEAITCVVLRDLTLDALVPLWLINTCPNMRRLEPPRCNLTGFSDPVDALPLVPQLRELHLDREIGQHLEQPSFWHHQLRALPNLNTLSLKGCYEDHMVSPLKVLNCFSVIGPQLTRLCMLCVELPKPFPVWLPCLVELLVPRTALKDADVEAVLSLHSVRVVHCLGFELEQSHIHRPCHWTELSFRSLRMASFDRLPLPEHIKLVSYAAGGAVVVNADLAAVQRVVAKVGRCGGLARCSDLRVSDWENGAAEGRGLAVPVDSTRLAAALPMLSACKCDCLTLLAHVTPELLAVMGQHLSSSMVPCIQFANCTWSPAVWPVLLSSLPEGIDVMFSDNDLSEGQVVAMCVHACRPVSVYLDECMGGRDPGGVEQLVQDAMAASGHQHVELVLDKGYDPSSSDEEDSESSDEDDSENDESEDRSGDDEEEGE